MLEMENMPEELSSNTCYIDINGQSAPVIGGYVVDPVSKISTKLGFFYLSECGKMVHIDFEDALEEIRHSLKRHKCRKIADRNRERDSNKERAPVESHSADQFVYLCQKLEDLNKKLDSFMNGNKDSVQRKSDQQNETQVVVDVHRQDEDTCINTSSESELNKSFIKVNDNKVHNISTQKTPQHSGVIAVEQRDKQAPVRELNNSEKSFYIATDELQVIRQWANKNRSFLPYKGMSQVPVGTYDTDDAYFIALLCALNPAVVLEQLFSLDSQRPNDTPVHVESSGELSQEEFAKYLGLTQRKTFDDIHNPLHSKKLRSKSNLARQANDSPSSLSALTPHPSEKQQVVTQNNTKKSSTDRAYISQRDSWRFPNLRQRKSVDGQKYVRHMVQAYTVDEDRVILKWVLSKVNVNKVKGNALWQELENKQLVPIRNRTWQSLRTRFLKTILCQLKEYGLDKKDIHKIIQGAQKGILYKEDKIVPVKPNYCLVIKKDATDRVNAKISSNKPFESANRPELRSAKRKINDGNNQNHNIYSDIDKMSDEAMNMSYGNYKKKLKSDEKKPLEENSAYAIRSKGRKLFTQRTFVASMSDNTSVG